MFIVLLYIFLFWGSLYFSKPLIYEIGDKSRMEIIPSLISASFLFSLLLPLFFVFDLGLLLLLYKKIRLYIIYLILSLLLVLYLDFNYVVYLEYIMVKTHSVTDLFLSFLKKVCNLFC